MDKSERDHKSKQIVYSSIVEYDFDVKEFADEEILGLAEQGTSSSPKTSTNALTNNHAAHKEMFIIHKDWHNKCYGAKKNMKKWQPTVMTVIAVGKKVFFASSLKLSEPNIMINKENAITEALSQCRMRFVHTSARSDLLLHTDSASAGLTTRMQGPTTLGRSTARGLTAARSWPRLLRSTTRGSTRGIWVMRASLHGAVRQREEPCSIPVALMRRRARRWDATSLSNGLKW
jgi:hypothetical protein